MLPLHVDVRLGIDEHLLRLKHFLIGTLRFLERSRLNRVKVVVPLLRLLREDNRAALAVCLCVGLDECANGLMNHVAVQAAKLLSASDSQRRGAH